MHIVTCYRSHIIRDIAYLLFNADAELGCPMGSVNWE